MTHEGVWNFRLSLHCGARLHPNVYLAILAPKPKRKLIWVGHADIYTRGDSSKYWTACVTYAPSDNLLSFANYIWLQGFERQPPYWPMPVKTHHPKPDVTCYGERSVAAKRRSFGATD